ncbi:defective chorion-1 protein, FC125 isoform isoform X1 [Drosophila pseudoobscura]|uniref:Defective chorion-1 protein, FC125 isoform isoform X1 n=1 Tax=Drosophila pseudoobscura pseudoobscura TaxID=46245 RepID=A0A6I8V005_DROPS|nr:defective chorion-1 protein, FC125 isoform isoform X1 [Drosophila pseudoobscura]
MRLQCLLLLVPLLALVLCGQVLGQETPSQATVTTKDAAEQEITGNGTAADTRPRFPTEETILGQMPPITPIRSGVPSIDAFYLLFPALGSLLRWGALFPAQSVLGAVPDSLQPTAAASKVVLVLADDPTAKTRVTRQDTPPAPNAFGQLLAQMPNPNFAQGWMNPANFNPDSFNLGQIAPNVGQALTTMQLPPMPQFGFENILGAAPPPPPAVVPPPPAEPAPPAAPAADEPAAPVAAPNPFSFLTPNNFDVNQLLGQAQQALPPMPPMPAMPSNVDFFSNLRQMWPGAPPASPGPAPGSDGQASDISEVRVRPEAADSQENALDDKERVPLLWFRMPMNRQGDEGEAKPLEDLRVEAKLRAFERQVIAELKMLQQIERVAKEMRSSATSSSGSPYKVSYPLSRTPVHKITRADIERALRDDYVRRLLHKEAQRKSRANHAAFKRQTMPSEASMSKEDIVKIMAYAYRMATEQQSAAQEKSKEDKIYAAYRATGEAQGKPENPQMMQHQQRQMQQQQPMPQMQQRQWEAEQNEAKIQQNPMMMQQRQWEAEQNEAKMQQQRQMMAEQQQQQNPMMMQQRQWEAEQNEAKMQQQRQMMAEQQQPMTMQQRQWEAEQNEAKLQQNPMMMQQRQMMAEHAQMQQQQIQRQMMAEHAQMQQQPMMMQQRMEQQPMMMMQQPVRMEQQPMMMQQRQMSMAPPQMQQNPIMQQQRQWEAEKNEAKMQQNPMMMQQRQWEAEKNEAKMQQNPMMMMQQQRQMTMDPMQMQQLDMRMQLKNEDPMHAARQWGEPQGEGQQEGANAGEEGESLLGEAEPQMPEVPGQARHKGVDVLGLGGNKRKKSKHGQGSPTVINYYAVQQQQPRPQPVPSYGTSYGGGGYGSNAYGGGGYSSSGYSSSGYRAALGNEEVDEMLRQHQTMARTINPGNPNGVQQQQERSVNQTTPQTTPPATPQQRLHKSQSSASTASESASASASETESDPTLGSKYTYSEGLLHPYMGLLPVSRPDDPWTHKAYDPHHALYTGGGSYAAYLKDSDGRRRRDTHIMPQIPQQRSLLTPDMLERLLRIKIEFQRRFPHLYKTMLSHHTNQTRVEVQPPLLGRKTAAKKRKPKYESEEGPVYELGAAERGLFEEEEEDQAEAETEVEDIEPDLDLKESQESSDPKNSNNNTNNNNDDDDDMDNSGRNDQDDNELDYFRFDDDTDNVDDSSFVIPK